ncbi:MAG: ATP-binding protein [Verrucomicrobiota bacterium]
MADPERSIQLSKLSQEFQDSALEEQFHQDHWKERSRQNLTTVSIWILVVVFLLALDWDSEWSMSSALFYIIQIAGFFTVRWLSKRTDYYHSYDALLTLTLTAMIMCVVSFRLLEPDNTVALALFIMTPLVVTIALNIRFYYTLLLVCIIIMCYSWALHRAELFEEFNQLVATQMFVSAGIGLIIQRLINASRHHDYARLITEQHFRQKLSQARVHAEKANQQKSMFLAQASHDIRTPMTGVLGLSRLLQKTDLDEKQLSLLHAIEASSNSLTNLMNQLLDLSRIEQGVFKLNEIVFSPGKTVQEVSNLLRPLAAEKFLRIKNTIHPAAQISVHGDEGRLRQILINLISNAIQYTEEGEICVELDIQNADGQKKALIFKVTDSGEGIPAHEQDEIFNSFYQSDTIRNSYGLGLGLSISRELAKALHGSLGYSMTTGQRSTFTLSLPVTVLEGSARAQSLLQPSTKPLTGRILIVEDNRINSLVIKETLLDIEPQFDIDTAFDGETAVAYCKERDYDLILMDCVLPKMNGFTALRHIRDMAKHQNTTIAAVTASAAAEDEKRCHDAGFNYFLTKPLKEVELQNILSLHLTIHDTPSEDRNPSFLWRPAHCLRQMGGRQKTLVKAVTMAIEDLPLQFRQISENGLTQTQRSQRIHQFKGTLKTLHVYRLPDQLEKLNHLQQEEAGPALAQIGQDVKQLTQELEQWLSRQ